MSNYRRKEHVHWTLKVWDRWSDSFNYPHFCKDFSHFQMSTGCADRTCQNWHRTGDDAFQIPTWLPNVWIIARKTFDVLFFPSQSRVWCDAHHKWPTNFYGWFSFPRKRVCCWQVKIKRILQRSENSYIFWDRRRIKIEENEGCQNESVVRIQHIEMNTSDEKSLIKAVGDVSCLISLHRMCLHYLGDWKTLQKADGSGLEW